MQRKGRKYKDKIVGAIPTSYHKNISNKLHSIPKLKKNVKSNVIYSIPSIAIVALLSGLFFNIIFSNNSCYAESAVTLTLGDSTLSTNATMGDTAYVSSTIKAEATNVTDYTLSITGPVGLEGSSTNNSTTIVGAGGNTPANMPNNSWGYYYDTTGTNTNLSNSDKTYNSFTGNAQTLESGTTPSGIPKNITFAAKFDNTAEAGHYTAKVTVNLVATPKALFKVTYDAVGGTGAPSAAECGPSEGETSCTLTLDTIKPTKSGYAFIGWDTNSSATNVAYRPKERIALSENTTLYAVWKQLGIWEVNGSTTNAGSNNMQDITSICSKVTAPATTATDAATPKIYLQDTRDGSTYTVRKLADGKCWMTDNLHLRLTAGTTIVASVNATTNGTAIWTPTESTLTDTQLNQATGDACSKNFYGTSSNRETCYYKAQSYITTPSPVYSGDTVTNYAGETGYYSYTAATAGSATSSVTSGEANYSICPKGWRLPLGSSSSTTGSFYNTFYTLYGITNDATGSTKVRDLPFNFQYTGSAGNGSLNSSTSGGYWWSSTVSSTYYSYAMYVLSSYVYPGTNSSSRGRYFGYAVRCVSQDTNGYDSAPTSL